MYIAERARARAAEREEGNKVGIYIGRYRYITVLARAQHPSLSLSYFS